MRSGGIRDACVGRNDELIRCEDDLCRPTGLDFGPGDLDKLVSPREILAIRVFGFHRENLLPLLGRNNKRRLVHLLVIPKQLPASESKERLLLYIGTS